MYLGLVEIRVNGFVSTSVILSIMKLHLYTVEMFSVFSSLVTSLFQEAGQLTLTLATPSHKHISAAMETETSQVCETSYPESQNSEARYQGG